MGSINMGRLLGGGLLAGVVLNLFEFLLNGVLLKREWEEVARHQTLAPMETGKAILIWVIVTFGLGLAVVWIYSALRTRFGAGPRTAVIAGVTMWLIVNVLIFFSYYPLLQFSPRMCAIAISVGLIEYVLAALLGGWVYRERS